MKKNLMWITKFQYYLLGNILLGNLFIFILFLNYIPYVSIMYYMKENIHKNKISETFSVNKVYAYIMYLQHVFFTCAYLSHIKLNK